MISSLKNVILIQQIQQRKDPNIETMINAKMLELGENSSEIRDLYEYGNKRKAELFVEQLEKAEFSVNFDYEVSGIGELKHFELYLPVLNLMMYEYGEDSNYGYIYDNILTANREL